MIESPGGAPIVLAALGSAAPRRSRKTSARVHWVDRFTTWGITLGGIAVILAVLAILVYLVWVVWPLFSGAHLATTAAYPLVAPARAGGVLFAELDEYRELGICVFGDGELLVFAARSGAAVERRRLWDESAVATAHCRPPGSGVAAFGFADGSVRLVRLGFETVFLAADEAPAALAGLGSGESRAVSAAVVERTSEGELRRVSAAVTLAPPLVPGLSQSSVAENVKQPFDFAGGVALLDYRTSEAGDRLATFGRHGLAVHEITRRENFLTGETVTEVASSVLPFPAELAAIGPARYLLLTTMGDQLYLGWSDGSVARYDLRDLAQPHLVERADFTPDPGVELTALTFSFGEQSLLAGDSAGGLDVWFRVPRPFAGEDGFGLVRAHRLRRAAAGSAAVTALAISSRDKSVAAGAADGSAELYHMTSERLLARLRLRPAAPIAALQLAPKADGLFVLTGDGRAALFDLANPHPEITLASLFGKIWYEGYPEPDYTWQSSSGTDDFEPKFSLVPLIFGTLKATVYSLLFAIPIALFAAIYTSEFLDRRYRAPLKSTIELMASLPSVVLGFIAALVLAPLTESWVVAILLAFGLGPVLALGAGYVWQALPARLTPAVGRWAQFALLLGVVSSGLWIAVHLAPAAEAFLFAGDFKAWLDGRAGSAVSGLAVVAWPPVLLGLLIFDRRVIVGGLGRRLGYLPRAAVAWIELGKYALLFTASLAGAWFTGILAAALGFDVRPWLLGTYVQRNALVVGTVMGFAVIPIIYTIAEDALSAVPESLRSASLGCGATRWQTATRVVLPVALSGIFSAVMVGLGRAVGETMIVLMAAGNTPIIDMNLFNGMRTLSANIAVELPEAVRDGTLYRMLFLAALTLFVLTFVINTVAEVVRQRFRRRAFQL